MWTGSCFSACLVAPGRIGRLADPAHHDWHHRSLTILFEALPDVPCYLDASEGPDWFRDHGICAGHDACSPDLLLYQRLGGSNRFGQSEGLFRYLVDSCTKKQESCHWIAFCIQPLALWFCEPSLPPAENAAGPVSRICPCGTAPSDTVVAVQYFWDRPEIEILSDRYLDITPLLNHGWKRRSSMMRYLRRLLSLIRMENLNRRRSEMER